jgi:beta-mannosidase
MTTDCFYLDNKWSIKESEFNANDENLISDLDLKKGWLSAEVPGDVHVDLYKAGKIKDPYYSDNSKECEWVTEKDWIYRKTFTVSKEFLKEKTNIVFDGIDTYATVWLNGKKIGECENMFREFNFDITDVVKENEENELIVKVKSIKHMMENFPYQKYFACFNTARIFVRKAQCHFGWDWAPELPATGIWQGVKIISQAAGNIENVSIKTLLDGKVSFFIKVDRMPTIDELAQSKEEIGHAKIEDELFIQVCNADDVFEKKIIVRGGKNFTTLEIPNPKLWWPNGYGEPSLYNYKVTLLRNSVELDSKSGKFGIRDIELKQEPLKEGGFGFQFLINKTPIYCKGANWVPLDCFTGTIKDEKYKTMIRFAKEANFNMLRVWGGGIYEKDIFYDLCDEQGIMVWQDFMFACSDVPDDHAWFVEMVIPEIEYQVNRLKIHPSIVYWCGGNEKTGSYGLKKSYGDKLFHYIIRGICNNYDDTRPYGAASPFSFSDLGNDQDSGDTHCNCLESSFKRGMLPFREEIEKIQAVFNSECAIQGPARFQSVDKFIPENKQWPLNDLWSFRYKDNPYNTLVEDYLDIQRLAADIFFGECNDVKDFLKKGMTAHSEILKAEIEHQRCRKWTNAGFMFWMYSDIWPTGTWAVVDYYGVPKSAYYAVGRAYNPLLVSIQQLNGDVKVFVSNDLLEKVEGKFEYGQAKVDGQLIWSKKVEHIVINANEALEVVSVGSMIQNVPNSYIFARLQGDKYKANTTFFHKLWKDIDWQEPVLSMKVIDEKTESDNFVKVIVIKAEKYARAVNLNLPENIQAFFSDNFFDLEAGESKIVSIVSDKNYAMDDIRIDNWLTEWI